MDNPPSEQPQKHSKTAIVAFILSLLAAIFLMEGLTNDRYVFAFFAAALISFILAVTSLLKRKSKKHFAVLAIIVSLLSIATFLFIFISIVMLFSMFFSLLLGR